MPLYIITRYMYTIFLTHQLSPPSTGPLPPVVCRQLRPPFAAAAAAAVAVATAAFLQPHPLHPSLAGTWLAAQPALSFLAE